MENRNKDRVLLSAVQYYSVWVEEEQKYFITCVNPNTTVDLEDEIIAYQVILSMWIFKVYNCSILHKKKKIQEVEKGWRTFFPSKYLINRNVKHFWLIIRIISHTDAEESQEKEFHDKTAGKLNEKKQQPKLNFDSDFFEFCLIKVNVQLYLSHNKVTQESDSSYDQTSQWNCSGCSGF